MKNILLVVSCLLLIHLTACDEIKKRQNSKALQEEARNRKLKRVTKGQIQEAALWEGKQISEKLQDIFLAQQPDSSQLDCEIAKNLQLKNDVLIKHTLYCQKSALMSAKEMQIWEAYQYNQNTQPLQLGENLQKLNEDEFLFTVPLMHQNKFSGMWVIVLSKRAIVQKI